MDHFDDGASLACTKVPFATSGEGRCGDVVEGGQVALCQVDNVNVIANRRAVFRWVIVSEHGEMGTTTDGYLGEIRE